MATRSPVAGSMSGGSGRRSRKVHKALQHLPLGQADQVATGRTLGWWQEWLSQPDPDDAYWQQIDWSPTVVDSRAPVAMVTSWQDLLPHGSSLTGATCPLIASARDRLLAA